MSTDPQQQELGLRETNSITRVEEYEFEPIQGYPMLKWQGKRPFTSTQYYPAQHKETYGPEVNGWRNKIYWGDNLQVMSHLLREYRGKVQLIYIDPPFASKADYKRNISARGKEAQNDQSVFEEKQYSDIWANDEYVQFMYERLILIRELLSENGSIYVHLDWHVGYHIKIILDEIFGSDRLQNDIIWHYSGWNRHGDMHFNRRHDLILFYSKNPHPAFNSFTIPWESEEEYVRIRKQKILIDENGHKYVLSDAGNGKRAKRYLDEAMSHGKPADDVWDIDKINNSSKESVEYPTQKPEALLERIIKSSSSIGDLVFDCFMGSGTTQAVSMKLGRRFIGADINLGAVQITTKRLLAVASKLTAQSQMLIPEEGQSTDFYTGIDVYNVNNYDIFRNPVQAKELLIQALEVNPLPVGGLFDGEQDGRMVKIMPINRIATRQDLNELILGFDQAALNKRYNEHPNQPVEKVTLVCMGHEPDLAATLQTQMAPFKLDVKVVDILRDKQDLHFKREPEAQVVLNDGYLVIEQFYPLNLMSKLSEQKEDVTEWRELVDSIMVDWNYDGAVLQPAIIDVPEGNALVAGRYKVPDDAGTIRVKITDLLSESLEKEIPNA